MPPYNYISVYENIWGSAIYSTPFNYLELISFRLSSEK